MTAAAYREFPVPDALRRWLVCVWEQEVDVRQAWRHRVLPDGCMDLVWFGGQAPVLAGPADGFQLIDLAAGLRVLGVRFRPGAAVLVGPPAHELLNLHVASHDVLTRAGRELADWRRPEGLANAEVRAGLFERLGRALADAGAPDPVSVGAVRWLAGHPEGRIEQFARASGLSARQLQRRMRAAVGCGPKQLQRILRLQRALQLARAHRSLAGLAATAGYADQAHLCREARELAGLPASALFRGTGGTLAMSDLFKTD